LRCSALQCVELTWSVSIGLAQCVVVCCSALQLVVVLQFVESTRSVSI